MEAPEVPLEPVREHVEHHAHATQDKFVSAVALSTAFLAALAAVAALLAGDNANEAMISQIQASDQWSYYQAKGIKSAVLNVKRDMLEAQGRTLSDAEAQKIAAYSEEQKAIKKAAEEKQRDSEVHLRQHKTLAAGVTMFQLAIAVGAISALTKRRSFWVVSLVFGLLGAGFLLRALLAAHG